MTERFVCPACGSTRVEVTYDNHATVRVVEGNVESVTEDDEFSRELIDVQCLECQKQESVPDIIDSHWTLAAESNQ